MEEIKRGGKRDGAGRKPSGVEKETVSIFVEKGKIWKFGTKEKLKKELYGFIETFGQQTNIQDLTKSTIEIKPQETPKTNYAINTAPIISQPLMNQEMAYMQELKGATIISEIQAIIKAAKADTLLSTPAKIRIEKYGQELSKTMYTD